MYLFFFPFLQNRSCHSVENCILPQQLCLSYVCVGPKGTKVGGYIRVASLLMCKLAVSVLVVSKWNYLLLYEARCAACSMTQRWHCCALLCHGTYVVASASTNQEERLFSAPSTSFSLALSFALLRSFIMRIVY